MEGRARHQRDHGRRRPAAAGVPGHPDRDRDRGGGPLDPVPATRRRHLGHLPRRAGRPVHHRRGVGRAAPGRRRGRRTAHGPGGDVRPRPRRAGVHPGVHPDLARAVRRLVLGRPAGAAAGAHLPAEVVPAQRVRLGLLGPADGGAAHDRVEPAPGPPASVHRGQSAHRRPRPPQGHLRAAGPAPAPVRPPSAEAPAPQRPPPGRRLDRRPAGGGRVVGRDPAALGVLAARAAPDGPPARPSRGGGRDRRAGRVHRPGTDAAGLGAAAGGVPVPGVGHRVGRHRPARRRRARRRRRGAARDHLVGGRGDPGARRLGGAPPGPGAGRLGVRVRQRRLPRHRRHGRGRARPAPGRGRCRRPPRGGRGRRAGGRLGRRHAVPRRRLGRVRRGQHPRGSPTGCRSATSAR